MRLFLSLIASGKEVKAGTVPSATKALASHLHGRAGRRSAKIRLSARADRRISAYGGISVAGRRRARAMRSLARLSVRAAPLALLGGASSPRSSGPLQCTAQPTEEADGALPLAHRRLTAAVHGAAIGGGIQWRPCPCEARHAYRPACPQPVPARRRQRSAGAVLPVAEQARWHRHLSPDLAGRGLGAAQRARLPRPQLHDARRAHRAAEQRAGLSRATGALSPREARPATGKAARLSRCCGGAQHVPR